MTRLEALGFRPNASGTVEGYTSQPTLIRVLDDSKDAVTSQSSNTGNIRNNTTLSNSPQGTEFQKTGNIQENDNSSSILKGQCYQSMPQPSMSNLSRQMPQGQDIPYTKPKGFLGRLSSRLTIYRTVSSPALRFKFNPSTEASDSPLVTKDSSSSSPYLISTESSSSSRTTVIPHTPVPQSPELRCNPSPSSTPFLHDSVDATLTPLSLPRAHGGPPKLLSKQSSLLNPKAAFSALSNRRREAAAQKAIAEQRATDARRARALQFSGLLGESRRYSITMFDDTVTEDVVKEDPFAAGPMQVSTAKNGDDSEKDPSAAELLAKAWRDRNNGVNPQINIVDIEKGDKHSNNTPEYSEDTLKESPIDSNREVNEKDKCLLDTWSFPTESKSRSVSSVSMEAGPSTCLPNLSGTIAASCTSEIAFSSRSLSTHELRETKEIGSKTCTDSKTPLLTNVDATSKLKRSSSQKLHMMTFLENAEVSSTDDELEAGITMSNGAHLHPQAGGECTLRTPSIQSTDPTAIPLPPSPFITQSLLSTNAPDPYSIPLPPSPSSLSVSSEEISSDKEVSLSFFKPYPHTTSHKQDLSPGLLIPTLSPTTSTNTGYSSVLRTPSTSSTGHSPASRRRNPVPHENDESIEDGLKSMPTKEIKGTSERGLKHYRMEFNSNNPHEFGTLMGVEEESDSLSPLPYWHSRVEGTHPSGNVAVSDEGRRKKMSRISLFGRRRETKDSLPKIAVPRRADIVIARDTMQNKGDNLRPKTSLTNLHRSVLAVASGLTSTRGREHRSALDGSDSINSYALSPTTPSFSGEGSNSRMSLVQKKNSTTTMNVTPLSPRMHSHKSIMIETHAIEDEESRHLSEVAFLL